MDAARRILADGAIAIKDGAIVAIGPDREVAPTVEAANVRDVGSALVHPGFVDGHVHVTMDITRGLMPESFDRSRIWQDVEKPFFAGVTPEEEYCGSLLASMEMVANGTTLFADTGGGFNLDASVKAINEVGMRGIPGFYLADVPSGLDRFLTPTDDCLRKLEEEIERYPFHSEQRVRCAVELAGLGNASDRLLVEAKALADEYQVPMIMHQSWDENEVCESLEQHGRRPVEHLADLGILGLVPYA
jgi:cytosine/adenosine deaminase-related metal-dependent hydrolase